MSKCIIRSGQFMLMPSGLPEFENVIRRGGLVPKLFHSSVAAQAFIRTDMKGSAKYATIAEWRSDTSSTEHTK